MTETVVQLAHGGGGRLSRDFIDAEILGRFGSGPLEGLPDGATLPSPGQDIVFTTDSFVVQPLEFPGGNIGDLAVHGTVNDIAACGGRPQWLSVGLILEEGLELVVLHRILDSLKAAADACHVVVATGDTKVVGRGQCDGLYINTAGIGEKLTGFAPAPSRIRENDAIIVSGPVGDHGMAVLSARAGIAIENGPQSDTGPVHRLVSAIHPMASEIHFMRDPTRGGLATVLNESVEGLPLNVYLDETTLPVSPETHAICEMLGLDPLHVASEGRLIAFCPGPCAAQVLTKWQALPEGRRAVQIGHVVPGNARVVMRTVTGGNRLVDVPRGELLPRIC